jgi:hypothetical protein
MRRGLSAPRHPALGFVPARAASAVPIAAAFDRAFLGQIRDASVLFLARMSSAEQCQRHGELLESSSVVEKEVPDAQLVVVAQSDDVTCLHEKAASLVFSNDVLFLDFGADDTPEPLRH